LFTVAANNILSWERAAEFGPWTILSKELPTKSGLLHPPAHLPKHRLWQEDYFNNNNLVVDSLTLEEASIPQEILMNIIYKKIK
jgi:hypothetical protein